MTEKKDTQNRAGKPQKSPGEDMQQEKDDNFRTFFDNVGDIIIVGSPDGKILPTRPPWR